MGPFLLLHSRVMRDLPTRPGSSAGRGSCLRGWCNSVPQVYLGLRGFLGCESFSVKPKKSGKFGHPRCFHVWRRQSHQKAITGASLVVQWKTKTEFPMHSAGQGEGRGFNPWSGN